MIRPFRHAFRLNRSKILNPCRLLSHVNFELRSPEVLSKQIDIDNLISKVSSDIKSYLRPESDNLKDVIHYNFSCQGKMIRPRIIVLIAAAINYHIQTDNKLQSNTEASEILALLPSQYQIALIGEMIHTASLIHDDLIDCSDMRRSIVSCHKRFGPGNAVLGGDYILICASQMLAKIGNTEVISVVAELINDIIKGEIMQLTNLDNIDEELAHYYQKSYRKTASLIANCCKAVGLLAGNCQMNENLAEISFEFGRNIGMTFQLIDDILDVTGSEKHLGKPADGADMKLGIATGPVLFASEKFPQVKDIIKRKLSKKGDLEQILEYIEKAKGIEQTKMVARIHHENALKVLRSLADSSYRKMLENLSEKIFNRTR